MANLRSAHLLLFLLLLLPHRLHSQGAFPADMPTLRPGDVIRVVVWREPDLSGEFPVDENGQVVLPMLGVTEVVGVPLPQLREQLLSEYRHQLRNPSIQITPLRRVMVLGEVYQPGLKELDPTMSLASAVALAGGPTWQGKMDRVRVVRDGRVIRTGANPLEAIHAIDVRSGDQIIVGRRSWIESNLTFLISTSITLTLLAIQLL
jgi:protein involved in polysaccharide export with SLBB domain